EPAENEAVAPVGKVVVISRAASNAPDEPDPVPLSTVTSKVAAPKAHTCEDCASMTTNPTLAPSVNVVCAINPDVSPVAVSVKVVPRSPESGENIALIKLPSASATEERVRLGSTSGSSCRTSDTVSPGIQPEPVMITISPGA